MKSLVPLFTLIAASVMASAEPDCPHSSKENWLQAVPKNYQSRAEYAFLEAKPNLPNVLIIGDSISMSYTVGVRKELAGLANVYRAPDNCRSTRQTLEFLDTYLGKIHWDVVHFNWGIHDLTHLSKAGKAAPPPAGKHQVGLDEYRLNLGKLIERLKKTDARLLWSSTTPIGQKAEAKGYRLDRDIVGYNAAAERVMQANAVEINDLYSLTKPRAEKLLSDGVHFNGAGTKILAGAVAGAIRSELRWFREDFTETPQEIPVQQKHLANASLILKRLGPGEGQIKRSFHENKPGDPYYVWSGLCPGTWALAFEHRTSTVDLTHFGKVRWRTKQMADRGTPESNDWIVDEIDVTTCGWFRLNIKNITKGEQVGKPDLSRVREIGFTDLMPGGKSKACSRLDWLEVYGKSSGL